MKDDIVIAVDVSSPIASEKHVPGKRSLAKEDDELSYFSFLMKRGFQFLPKVAENQLNYYTLLSQSGSLMIQQISAMTIEMYPPDILIQIPINSYGPYHFYKSEEIIQAGVLATRKALVEF